ncbi:Titin [Symbiodinium microadriaticum]|uniref:Titin n=1 Tax=Symbiodinium microadriaticum TaxID=2951 RepID=A0A1Q9E144_SYMMI|nr:Titin [Symbiodinium microadriaticum]
MFTVAQHSVRLQWAAPEHSGGATVEGYQVELLLAAGTQLVRLEDVAENAATVVELDGDTEYQFRVQVVTSWGLGEWSNFSAKVSTAEVPPFPPEAPTASDIYEDSFRMSWKPPRNGGFEILGYRLFLREADEDDNWTIYEMNTNSNETSSTMEGLQAGTSYDLAIAGINALGVGLLGDILSVQTASFDLSRPGRVVVVAIGQSWATISWAAPASPTASYAISLQRDGSDEFVLVVAATPCNRTVYTVRGLEGFG